MAATGVTVPRVPVVGFSHGWLDPASPRPSTSRSADLAIAQSMGDMAPFALAAAAGCNGSEPVMSPSALAVFSDLESKAVPVLALGELLSPSFSPKSEGKDMLQPAI